jgi:hypothetical protein
MKSPISKALTASIRLFSRKEALKTLTLVIPNEVRDLQSAARCRSLTSFGMTRMKGIAQALLRTGFYHGLPTFSALGRTGYLLFAPC